MGMIGGLIRALRTGKSGARSWTPEEVRELISRSELETASLAAERLTQRLPHRDAETDCLRGEIAFHQKKDDEAVVHFRSALNSVPGLAQAHYGLSLVFAARGEFDDAVRHAQFAQGPIRRNGRYLAQLGYCHLCLGNYQIAESVLRRATLEMSNNKYLWNNLGIVLRVKGEADEARQCFKRALKLDSTFDSAREHLTTLEAEIEAGAIKLSISTDNSHMLRAHTGVLDHPGFAKFLEHEQNGEFQQAIDACEAFLVEMPDDERIPVFLSRLYERVGDVDSATDTLVAHLSTHPDASDAAGALGLVYLRAEDYRSSIPLLKQALSANEDHLDYVVGLGRALSGQDRFEEAAQWFERAVELAPEDIGLIGQVASNLSNMCRYEEAMAIIDDLVARGMYVGCTGSVLAYLGRFDEALTALDRDIARQPSDPGLRFQRGQLHLLQGNYKLGWSDYAFRGLISFSTFRMLPFPVWRGESLKGKRVIVLAEQGLGDQIMFSSCLADLLAMEPERVVIEMSHRVAKTITRSFAGCEVVPTNQGANIEWVKQYPDTDCFIPLADLPGHFRQDIDSFPEHKGYLQAAPDRIAYWRARLESSGPGPYIGLAWSGGTELTRKRVRSLTPEELLPLGKAVKATWVALQYGKVQDDVDRMAGTELTMQYWPESISDLDEFAALIAALDLVVTVCNTTVHYAGALGKPVWVLTPKIPEWRYGLTGESLPWYPSSTMYRQATAGEWTELVATVGRDLSAHFGES